MKIIKSSNLAARFLLELCMLAAVGYWGFKIGHGWALKTGLGLGGPVLVAVVWGAFGAPRAPLKLDGILHVLLDLVVFGAGGMALYASGHPKLAWTFGLVYVLNKILLTIWHQ